MKFLVAALPLLLIHDNGFSRDKNHYKFIDSLPYQLVLGKTSSAELLALGYNADSNTLREHGKIVYKLNQEVYTYFTEGEDFINSLKIWEIPAYWSRHGITTEMSRESFESQCKKNGIPFRKKDYRIFTTYDIVYRQFNFNFEFPSEVYINWKEHPIKLEHLYQVVISLQNYKSPRGHSSGIAHF